MLTKNIFKKQASIINGVSITLFASILINIFGLISNLVLTRGYGPAYKGQIDLVYSTMTVGLTIFGLSLNPGITYIVSKYDIKNSRLGFYFLFLALFQGVLIQLALWLLAPTSLINAFIPSGFIFPGIYLVSISVSSGVLVSYWRSYLVGRRQFTFAVILDLGNRLMNLVWIIVTLLLFEDTEIATYYALIGITLIPSLIAVFVVLINHEWKEPFYLYQIKDLIRYIIPSYINSVTQYANYRLDIFFVAFYTSIYNLSLYALAVSIGQLLWLPSNAIQSVFMPVFTRESDRAKQVKLLAQMNRLMLWSVFLMSVFILITGEWLINGLFGEKFHDSIYPLLLLLPGIIFFTSFNVLSTYFSAIGKPKYITYSSLIGFFITIIGNFFLVPKLGIMGAALTSSISYFITSMILIYFFINHTFIHLAQLFLVTLQDIKDIKKFILNYLESRESQS